MEPNQNDDIIETIETDESELDASINETLSQLKAEHTGVVVPHETTESVEKSTTSVEAPSAGNAAPETESQDEDPKSDIRTPIQGRFESDESYAVRTQIAEMIRQRENASSSDEKEDIHNELKKFRKEFGHLIINNRSQSSISDEADSYVPPSKEEPNANESIDEVVERKLAERQAFQDNKSVIDSFFEKTPELQDQNIKQVFVDFFDANYKIEGKSPREVAQVLDLAKQAMFRPAETVQEKVLKGALVQEKVNAMQFPGGTIVQPGLTPDQAQSVSELVATGMSEAKARELILD